MRIGNGPSALANLGIAKLLATRLGPGAGGKRGCRQWRIVLILDIGTCSAGREGWLPAVRPQSPPYTVAYLVDGQLIRPSRSH